MNDTVLTINSIVNVASKLYSHLNGLAYYKHKLRPYICPFHSLIGYVPTNAKILDIGCGSGLFASLIVHFKPTTTVYGFDANKSAINTAQKMVNKNNGFTNSLKFEYRDARAGMPSETYDVVSMIDVLHHVPMNSHEDVIRAASERVAPGGILLYKDMVKKPLWRAIANRIHDLILAREWIHYANINNVKDWSINSGLTEVHSGSCNMLWYGHEWIVMQKQLKND